MEAFDSEIESLQSTVKRKQKPPARLAHLEESVTRHKTHIGRLEQIIRLLDNDAIQPEEVSRVVLEEIPEYIENNQEDFDAYEVRISFLRRTFASMHTICCFLLHAKACWCKLSDGTVECAHSYAYSPVLKQMLRHKYVQPLQPLITGHVAVCISPMLTVGALLCL